MAREGWMSCLSLHYSNWNDEPNTNSSLPIQMHPGYGNSLQAPSALVTAPLVCVDYSSAFTWCGWSSKTSATLARCDSRSHVASKRLYSFQETLSGGVISPPGAHGTLRDAFQQPSLAPKSPISFYNVFLPLNINTKLPKQYTHAYKPLTMIQVSLTAHNVTIYSLTYFPLQFCIPHCIAILLHHLEFTSLQSSTPATSLGPWGTIPRSTKPPATCCSVTRLPMDTGDNIGDHMQFGMAIARQHRPNLWRFDPGHLSHPNVPSTSHTTRADVSTACVLCIALKHGYDCSPLQQRWTRQVCPYPRRSSSDTTESLHFSLR